MIETEIIWINWLDWSKPLMVLLCYLIWASPQPKRFSNSNSSGAPRMQIHLLLLTGCYSSQPLCVNALKCSDSSPTVGDNISHKAALELWLLVACVFRQLVLKGQYSNVIHLKGYFSKHMSTLRGPLGNVSGICADVSSWSHFDMLSVLTQLLISRYASFFSFFPYQLMDSMEGLGHLEHNNEHVTYLQKQCHKIPHT